jgi:hypothetical protein
LPASVVLDHEAVADEFVRGVCCGSDELGGELLAQMFEAEALVHAQAEEDGFFEGFALEDVDGGGGGFLCCVVRELLRVGEADGSLGTQEHGVRVETEADVGVALPILAIVARLVGRWCEV